MGFQHFYEKSEIEHSMLKEATSPQFKSKIHNFCLLEAVRWWKKLKTEELQEIHVGTKKYHYCKMEETSDGNPSYLLKSRNGARYGLYKSNENRFHVVRLKSGNKRLIKPKNGYFTEVDGKLAFHQTDIEKVEERRANVEPDKSFPNGEKTFDNLMNSLNTGIYTDAKA